MDPRLAPTLADLIRLQHDARGFSFLHRQPVTSLLAGRRASRIRGRGLAFEEIRGYRPGDDIRLIDWRASARTGRMQTRVFSEERDRPTLLLVNLTPAMFFGSRHATKSATAADIAALAAWRGLRAGDRLGAILYGTDWSEEIRPHRSRATVMRILGAIARRATGLVGAPPAAPDSHALNRALRRASALVGHDWLVVLISDTQAADEESVTLITRLSRHNDVIAIPISDPLDRALPAPPWRGLATDGTAVVVLDPGRGGLGAAVERGYRERLERIRHAGLKLETPVLPVGTEAPPGPQLRAMLGAAAAPRRGRRAP